MSLEPADARVWDETVTDAFIRNWEAEIEELLLDRPDFELGWACGSMQGFVTRGGSSVTPAQVDRIAPMVAGILAEHERRERRRKAGTND